MPPDFGVSARVAGTAAAKIARAATIGRSNFTCRLIGASLARSSRLAKKTLLHRGYALDSFARERSLLGRGGGVFQVFERRAADERSRHRLVGNGEAHRQLDQTVGKPFANQRLEPPGTLDIGPVRGTRADRLDTRRAERMALLGPAQCAGGEHADRDRAHVGGLGMRQQVAEVICRVPRRVSRSGAGVARVVAELRAW